MTKLFKGIRKNVEVTNNSVSAGNIERLQRKAMHNLYEDENGNPFFIVVKTASVSDMGEVSFGHQIVGLSPVVMAFGKLNNEDVQVTVDGREIVTGPGNAYKLYNNIVLVSFRNTESMYEGLRLNGVEIDGELYYPTSGSASMGKKSKVFFNNEEADVQFEVMNKLTGGLLAEVIEIETEKKGELSFDDLAGIGGRVSLCATTPSLWTKAGRTNNIFYFNGSIESNDEQSNLNVVDNNFRDGFAVVSDTKGAEMVQELAKEYVTPAQARRMSFQLRIRGAAGKGHFRAYSYAQRLKEIRMMMSIDISKCYCWEDGKKVDLTKVTDKDLVRIAAKVDIIADKDVFKWGKYIINKETIDPMEIGIVNMSNLTSGSMGTQIMFKLRDDIEDATKYIAAVTERQLADAEAATGRISFEKDNVRLSNTAYYNCKNIAPERALTDKLLNNFKIKQLDTALLTKVANLKLSINSNYMRMVPEDHLLNDGVEVLGSRMVKYTLATGEVKCVKCLEVYSAAFVSQYRKLEAELKDNDVMTDAEKAVVLLNSRVCTGIKSPSQGDNEFEMFVMVLPEEIAKRNVTKEFMQFIMECPNNCIILAQDNTVKHQLAGSDFDGDDVTVIYPEFTMLEDGRVVTGLYYDGAIINDYTSLMVRKRVREGNKGYVAIIKYHDNKPMRLVETQEEIAADQDMTADYIKTMDINSLL